VLLPACFEAGSARGRLDNRTTPVHDPAQSRGVVAPVDCDRSCDLVQYRADQRDDQHEDQKGDAHPRGPASGLAGSEESVMNYEPDGGSHGKHRWDCVKEWIFQHHLPEEVREAGRGVPQGAADAPCDPDECADVDEMECQTPPQDETSGEVARSCAGGRDGERELGAALRALIGGEPFEGVVAPGARGARAGGVLSEE
jgi:hypothetical protein